MTVASHLGGYVAGGDVATYFPQLWRWLAEDRDGPKVRSVLDIGCGEGWSLRYFRDALGLEALGVDGTQQQDPDIVQHDFTQGPWIPDREFDLVWCCEFVEHVEERFAPNFAPALQAAPLVLMTHAFPGQAGHHHVNCQDPQYWLGFFAALGYQLNQELTTHTRQIAARDYSPWNHYLRSGMAFNRKGH